MNYRIPGSKKLKAVLALAVMPLPLAFAQDIDTEVEDVFELSPFVVSSDESDGYLASSSLTGTRVRTNLEDIASSISVVTPMLLEDTDTQDLNDLFQFTANTEAAGETGNYSGGVGEFGGLFSGNEFAANPGTATRVRGLDSPSLTRDLFRTTLNWDSYNVSQVEVVRGANSILFGQGSPAGLVNANLIQANFRERYQMTFRTDNNSSFRTVLDANVPIIDDKLAVRAAILIDNHKYRQNPAYEDDHRIFLTGLYKITDNLIFRANTEQVRIEASRPLLFAPLDAVTDYINYLGFVPDSDPHNDTFPRITIPANSESGRPALVNAKPSGIYNFRQFGHLFEVDGSFAGSTPAEYSLNSNWTQNHFAAGNGIIDRKNYHFDMANLPANQYGGSGIIGMVNRSFQDFSVVDWKNNNFWGNYFFQDSDYKTYQAKLEYVADNGNFGAELSFDSQLEEFDTNGRQYNAIFLNVAEYMFDGTPNPNLFRPAANINFNDNYIDKHERDNETVQLTAFAKFDFVKDAGWDNFFGRLLGNHSATFLVNENTFLNKIFSYDQNWVGEGVETIFSNNPSQSRPFGHNHRKNAGYVFVGPAITSLDNVKINPIQFSGRDIYQDGQVYPIHVWDHRTQQLATRDYTIQHFLEQTVYDDTTTETKAAILQSSFWDNHIVTTLGYREDDLTLIQRDYNFFPGTQARNPDDYTETEVDGGGDYFSWGIVVKSPRNWKLPMNTNFAFFYSESENFDPAAPGRSDTAGRAIPPPTGLTKDYGIRINTLDDKLQVKLNFFETESTLNEYADAAGFLGGAINFDFRFREQFWVDAMDDGVIAPEDQDIIEAYDAGIPPGLIEAWGVELLPDGIWSSQNFGSANITDTTDSSSEGMEVEIVYNPTKNWRILANISKQETVNTNTMIGYLAYLEERLPTLELAFNFPNSWPVNDPDNLYLTSEGYIDTAAYAPGGPGYNVSRGASHANRIRSLNRILSQQGQVVPEQRKWRFNLITNYAFDQDSALAGFEIGGSYRWQDKSAIGYPLYLDEDGEQLFDVTNPYYGDTLDSVGLWVRYQTDIMQGKVRWSIQLNVNNVFSDGEPIAATANSYGETAQVYLPNLRSWSITSRFTF